MTSQDKQAKITVADLLILTAAIVVLERLLKETSDGDRVECGQDSPPNPHNTD